MMRMTNNQFPISQVCGQHGVLWVKSECRWPIWQHLPELLPVGHGGGRVLPVSLGAHRQARAQVLAVFLYDTGRGGMHRHNVPCHVWRRRWDGRCSYERLYDETQEAPVLKIEEKGPQLIISSSLYLCIF